MHQPLVPIRYRFLLFLSLGVPAGTAAAQSVRGVVTDSASRRPLEGAIVSTGGVRTATDTRGEYRLTGLRPGAAVLRVQMIGYGPIERPLTLVVGQEQVVNISLALRPVQLAEVVAIGYGTAQRAALTTAVTSISAVDIENVSSASADLALQGKAPGVQVIENAGNPGNAISLRVRGSASLTANSQPLYVVDGVPLTSDDITQLDLGGQGMRGVSSLSASEIASIDVLKDAAATAIYGSRGSNGVVLITTKRGQAGRARVTFNSYAGLQRASKRLDLLNSTEYITYFNEAAANDGYGDEYFGAVGDADSVDTDWQDATLRTAAISNAELSVAGGTDQIRYRASGNYYNQNGVIIGSRYRRIGGRVNLDFAANPRLTFATTLAVSGETNQRVENDNSLSGVTTNVVGNAPIVPIRRADGSFTGTNDGLQYPNSVALAQLNEAGARSTRVLGSAEVRWQPSTAFLLTGRSSIDFYNVRETQYESPLIIGTYAASVDGVAKRAYSLATKYVADGFATYFGGGGNHAFQVTGGGSIELDRRELNFVRGEGLPNIDLHEVRNATNITSFDGSQQEANLVSVFARANYSYQDKYLLAATIRTDGSSVFGPDNRYGVFPGVSAAWLLNKESFMGDGLFDLLKLRASYGLNGNQAIGYYPWQSSACSANYGSAGGLYPCTVGNPGLHWERTAQLNIGTDIEMFDGRLALTAEWYQKKTNDLIVSRPIAGNSGFTSVFDNVGNMSNTGVELQISTINAKSTRANGFFWTTTLNVAHNKNEVTKLFGDQPFSNGTRLINRVEVGQPIGAFHAYRFLGVDPQTGDAIYDDINGDGDITSADRTIVGSPWPDFTGGLTNHMSIGGFDLTGFFQFSKGNKVFNGMRIFSDAGGYYLDNHFRDVLNRWQQPGDVTDQPRASYDGTSGAREVSSRFIEDASYIRLRELTFGYNLPNRVARRLGFDNARVYLMGRNVFTITDYTGYNPDVNSNGSTANVSLGTDFYAYPIARTFSFGVQLGW